MTVLSKKEVAKDEEEEGGKSSKQVLIIWKGAEIEKWMMQSEHGRTMSAQVRTYVQLQEKRFACAHCYSIYTGTYSSPQRLDNGINIMFRKTIWLNRNC